MENFKYRNFNSIYQFRDIVSKLIAQFPDKDNIPIIGYPKIHGSNARLVFESPTEVIAYSKSAICNELNNNFKFFQHVEEHKEKYLKLGLELKELLGDSLRYPFILNGEWAGKGIQKKAAVCQLPFQFFTYFGVSNYNMEHHESDTLSPHEFVELHTASEVNLPEIEELNCYHVSNYASNILWLNSKNPSDIVKDLVEITKVYELECPVASWYGVKGIGEGVVWQPLVDFKETVPAVNNTWFKVKGKDHASSEVRVLASVEAEEMKSIYEFVDYAVSENRVNQGITELNVTSINQIKELIQWVNDDIAKEEQATLEKSGLTLSRDLILEINRSVVAMYKKLQYNNL